VAKKKAFVLLILVPKLIVVFIGYLPGWKKISGSGLQLNSKTKLRPVNFITKVSAVIAVLCKYGGVRAGFLMSVSRLANAACVLK
jgi:hypothetical protein